MTTPVLVTDGNERATLAVTRALGSERIPVIVGSETHRSLAGMSKYCRRSFLYPSAYDNPKGFVDAVLDHASRHQVSMVLPISDLSMQLIGERADEFARVTKLAMPALSEYETVSDKYRLMKLAQDMGVPIPRTVYVEDGALPADDQLPFAYPVVVKPARSRVKLDGRWVATKVHLIANRGALDRLYRETPYLRLPSMIQQRVEGSGQGVFGLFDRGTPLALFAHRRLREKPPSGGVSVLRESIELPKAMTEYAVRLLQRVRWHGVAMVEFKIDEKTETPMLMEINARFWGSLQLALDANINFPSLLHGLISGRTMAKMAQPYAAGVKSRWFLGDLDHLLLRLRKSDQMLNLPVNYPSRWQCVREFLTPSGRELHYETERWSDPLPAILEYSRYVGSLIKSGA